MYFQPEEILPSRLCGEWVCGSGTGKPVLNSVSGDPITLIDTSGLDFQAMLQYARTVGAPALKDHSLHERALMLKAIGLALMESKELFYANSFPTGATRSDSWIDIEGGIGTLLNYASRARREIPNTQLWLDGDVEVLSADNTFSAQHVLSPLEGVAIHINAYNFPCWGMLEKLAPTLLAGMPAIIKPASQTAYLTQLMVQHIIELDILPEGSLQLISGSVGDLLDHVDGQDVVTFTGSASTGRKLRATSSIVDNSVRFTMEADSLNSAILAPDANPNSPEFDLFVREVAREMTVKAGQKCTAIRRVIVPNQYSDAVVDALDKMLSRIAVGDPSQEGTRMGPLVSLSQREDVQRCIKLFSKESEVVSGDHGEVNLESGDPEAGGFMNPVLLRCKDPDSAELVHELEAFGPVATVVSYHSVDQAVEWVKRGKGSLVSSVFTNDSNHAMQLTRGIAASHGRVMLGNRTSAKSSTGHGSPLPVLTHGGPGRAGGGEELGGVRAIKHYMQRTAIQGTPALLGDVLGQWVAGGKLLDDKRHPFRKSLAELELGDHVVTDSRVVSLEDIEHFAEFTGDTFYAHMDEDAARANPFFEGRVAHGYLVVSFAAGLFVDPEPGPVLANFGVDNLRFLTPVNAGDSLQVTLICKQINPRISDEYGEVRWHTTVVNQDDQVVAQYDVLTMVAKVWPAKTDAP